MSRSGRLAALVTAAVLAGAVPAFAQSSPAPAGTCTPTSPQLNVTFIPKDVSNPYFVGAGTGAQMAADALCGLFSNVGPQTTGAADQVPFITDATTNGVSAIGIAASSKDAVAPALQAAMQAGIKVVGFDSSPAEGAYNVFVNQVDFSGVGVNLADWACELAPNCTGDIAILSATATASNQNQWIELMKSTLTQPKYAGLKLVDTVYGDDKADVSTTQAQALLANHPDLKVIVAPTTVGILAAAQEVKKEGKSDSVKVTGLGFPNDMRSFVADGTSPVFGLWNNQDLGTLTYYVAAYLVSGKITGAPGETFTVPGLNGDQPYTIQDKSIVVLGPAYRFDSTNIDQFHF